jgi:hypothetical protein
MVAKPIAAFWMIVLYEVSMALFGSGSTEGSLFLSGIAYLCAFLGFGVMIELFKRRAISETATGAGFLKPLRFWNTDAMIESTVEVVSKNYHYYMKEAPERDRHFWLAAVFMNRPGYRVGKNVGAIIPFTRTTLFSVLEDDQALLALAYFFLSQEMPHVLPKLEKRCEEILRPAKELIAQGKFLGRCEQTNPWTAKNVPGILEVVASIEKEDK